MATYTYQEGVSSYAGTIDNSIRSSAATSNFGSEAYIAIGGTSNDYVGLLSFSNLVTGVTVSDAYIELQVYASLYTSGDTYSMYRVLKPWIEAQSTWNRWKTTSGAWGTAGCANASDVGTENTGDGTDYDRKSTAATSLTLTTDPGTTALLKFGSGDANFKSLVQSWVDGTATSSYGVAIRRSSGGTNNYVFTRSSEYATASNRPKLTIITADSAQFMTANKIW